MPRVTPNPSPAGARVLRRLAAGDVLVREPSGSLLLRHSAFADLNERVHPITVERLVAAGFVERKGGGCYEITAAGKSALEEPNAS